MFFFFRHSNGSGENDDGEDQPDDAGSLSRSASESSVAQAQIENGLNINNNGYTLVKKKSLHHNFFVYLSFCESIIILMTCLN